MYHFLTAAQQVLEFWLWAIPSPFLVTVHIPKPSQRERVDAQIGLASLVTNGLSVQKGGLPRESQLLEE